MPVDRFYLEDPLNTHTEVFLEGAELHHLAHVMRVKEGELVELVNGKGAFAEAKVRSLDKKKGVLFIEKTHKTASLPPQILLAVPLLRPSKLEWIVEKGTELGVDAFLFYSSEKGDKKDLSAHQIDRLHTLAVSAMKQSGRLFLPHFEILAHFSELFQKNLSILYGDTRSSASPLDAIPFPVLFVTGPESGFSSKELNLLETNGLGVSLSPHILRAETAPLAAATLLSWKKIILDTSKYNNNA